MDKKTKDAVIVLWKIGQELVLEAMLVGIAFFVYYTIIFKFNMPINHKSFNLILFMPILSFVTRMIFGEIILRYYYRYFMALSKGFKMRSAMIATFIIHIIMFYMAYTFFALIEGYPINTYIDAYIALTFPFLPPSLFAAVMAPYLLKRLSGSTFDSLIEKRPKKVKQS